jgi:phosphate:Na+ symporter
MMGMAKKSVSASVKSFLEDDLQELKPVPKYEQAIDNLQSAITQYLIELSQKELTQEESEELPVLIHNVNDIERIGDHSENIMDLAERKVEKKLPLPDDAVSELGLMWNEVSSMIIETEAALKSRDSQKAETVLMREQKVNHLQVELKKAHVKRLNSGGCDLKSGILFMDMVDNMEKIGDHLTNIAQGIIGGMRWTYKGDIHVAQEATA